MVTLLPGNTESGRISAHREQCKDAKIIAVPGNPIRGRGFAGALAEVWQAEQNAPIRRRVAIKLIKADMDTKQVVARFEADLQALVYPPEIRPSHKRQIGGEIRLVLGGEVRRPASKPPLAG